MSIWLLTGAANFTRVGGGIGLIGVYILGDLTGSFPESLLFP